MHLFVYSEDDILVTEQNLQPLLDVNDALQGAHREAARGSLAASLLYGTATVLAARVRLKRCSSSTPKFNKAATQLRGPRSRLAGRTQRGGERGQDSSHDPPAFAYPHRVGISSILV